MSRKRLGRVQRAATIVPLALLSAAWTASVAGIGGISSPVSAEGAPGASNPSVPSNAIKAPASLSTPGSVDGLGGNGNDAQIISTASTNEIPSAALAAYQRAESVINSADKSCHLTWQLVAAIGRVESNHGRADGNVLNDQGVSTPGIFGPVLNGKNGHKAIPDTDAGQYDNDTKWDRAVGPMQFIPSTWAVVGVDADGDGKRNPQDIDDAALATAVYLCSGTDDLSTLSGEKAAVFRYNNSKSYVNLVIKVMNGYLQGDYTSVPNNSTAAGYLVPGAPSYNGGGTFGGGNNTYKQAKTHLTGGNTHGTHSGSNTGNTGSNGGSNTGNNGGTSGPPIADPTTTPTNPVTDGVKKTVKGVGDSLKGITNGAGEAVTKLINGVLGPLTAADAAKECTDPNILKSVLSNVLNLLGAKNNCLESYGLK